MLTRRAQGSAFGVPTENFRETLLVRHSSENGNIRGSHQTGPAGPREGSRRTLTVHSAATPAAPPLPAVHQILQYNNCRTYLAVRRVQQALPSVFFSTPENCPQGRFL
eukprot:361544-Chlamydomonas_euryale.AAC.3